MEGEQIQSFWSNGNNPLDQELILKLILSHVGKTDVNDLLNCRLVRHSWNCLAVPVLEQHGYSAKLDYGRLVKYKALLWKTQVQRAGTSMLLEPKQLISLKLTLLLTHRHCDDDLSEVAEAAQLLMAYPHLQIAVIHRNYEFPLQEETNHELFTLMELVAKDLESLNFSLPADFRQRHYFEEFDFDCYTSLEFPKLTSVYHEMYSPSRMFPEREEAEVPDETKHIASIVKNAPNLTKLKLVMMDETTAGCVRHVLQICPPGLQELFVGEGPESAVIHVLPELKFPGLKVLNLDNLHDLTPTFSDFLKHNCPALTSLEISLFLAPFDDSDEEDILVDFEEAFRVEFPVLRNIEHIGLSGDAENLPSFVHRIFIGMLTQFPNTHSVRINFAVLRMLGKHLRETGQAADAVPSPVFPNISTLAVAFPCAWHKLNTGMDEARRAYLHTFPNVKTLTISSGQRFHALELLCSHPGIQALQIHIEAFGYLDTITENNPLLLQGLKCLKLVAEAGAYEENLVRLSTLLTRFPALKFIELPLDAVPPYPINAEFQLNVLKMCHPKIEFDITNYQQTDSLGMGIDLTRKLHLMQIEPADDATKSIYHFGKQYQLTEFQN